LKLLLDQNLSPRLVQALQGAHPGSAHVREFGLQTASDAEVWSFAKANGFDILSKDSDFHQMSFLYGPPPKVVWVRLGNCTTDQVREALLRHADRLAAFREDEQAAFVVLP
jgi:predicted nuclease of predicted toxin-antitoxin system